MKGFGEMATVKQVVEFTSSDVIRILSEAAAKEYGINGTDRANVKLVNGDGFAPLWNRDTVAAVLEVATVRPHNREPQ